MGNQIPESHNQSSERGLNESEAILIKSIVDDLVNSVHIEQTIMSNSEPSTAVYECLNNSTDLEDPSYYDTEQTFSTSPHYVCADDGLAENTPNTPTTPTTSNPQNTTVRQSDPFSPDFENKARDVTDLCEKADNEPFKPFESFNDNESEYSPKRTNGSDYVKLCRVSPTSQTSQTSSNSSLSDWKYSSNGYPNNEYNAYEYKTNGSKYDNLFDSWSSKKDTNNKNNAKPYSSKMSLLRNFDPLVPNEDKALNQSPKELRTPYKLITNNANPYDLNDSTGLVNQFQKFNIEETPKKIENTMNSPKPDVLAFAVDTNESIEKLDKCLEQLKEKDDTINDLKQQLKDLSDEKVKLLSLVNTFHCVNEDLVQICDSIETEKTKAVDERNGIEKSFFDLHKIYEKMRKDMTLCQENESSYRRQYSLATEKTLELERICKELKDKCDSFEKHQFSQNEKKELENELIASRVQYKKAEMKINSLQNQLDQKTHENTELSSMVDELILKVQK